MRNERDPATSSSEDEQHREFRFFPILLFLFIGIFLCIGGGSALLYLAFSEYSGVRNIWLLICGAPVLLIVVVLFTIITLYTRYGRPVEQIVRAIDAIAEGDLTVRVPEDNSPQFQRIVKRFNKMTAELERAEQQRRNLTADVAHELRTPLHIIQGNLEGVLDGVYEPTQDHITATLEETRLLARLVEDLQTLSLAEAGQLPLYKMDFPVADLLADVVTSFAGQAAESGIGLEVDAANDGRDLTLHADPDRLDQVLSNLVANALRHTPSGGRVTLRAVLSDGRVGGGSRYGFRYASLLNPTRPAPPYRDHPSEAVILSVEDTGEGIPPEDLPYIFDRFWRGDKSRTRGAGAGSGLGLAIARQLVEAHGGRIWAESEEGRGTRFHIELPVK